MIPWAVRSWAVLVAAAFAVGAVLQLTGVLTIDHAPPLHGNWRLLTITLLPAALFALLAVRTLPALTVRLGFRQALLISYGAAVTWAVLLSVSGDGLAKPFTHQEEYLAVLPAVGDDPLGWLAGFTRALPAYPTHVRGHPPLPVLVVWALARIGLPGALPAALLVILVGSSAVVAIALTVRRVVDEDAARRALPYLALSPAAVWIATSMDAFFAGVAAWGVALLVVGRRGSALGAGVLLGALPYLSYGLVPFLLLPVCLRPKRAGWVLAGAAAVSGAFLLRGFSWWDGVLATHAEWAADPGAARPYFYFVFANLGVLALVTGPATAAGLVRLGRLRLLVVPVLVAVIALDVSGVTRGEVERIWLPYALWLVVAARGMLGAQAVTGLALQALVRSLW